MILSVKKKFCSVPAIRCLVINQDGFHAILTCGLWVAPPVNEFVEFYGSIIIGINFMKSDSCLGE